MRINNFALYYITQQTKLGMKILKSTFILLLITSVVFTSCKKDPEEEDIKIEGCTDAAADNYNPDAAVNNGECYYQNRFISEYDVSVLCNQATEIFEDAKMSIQSAGNRDQVFFSITSSATDISFFGDIVNRNLVTIDTILKDFQADLKDLTPLVTQSQVVTVDLGIFAELSLSTDIKNLSGDMALQLISKDTIDYNGLKIPPITLEDECRLSADKK